MSRFLAICTVLAAFCCASVSGKLVYDKDMTITWVGFLAFTNGISPSADVRYETKGYNVVSPATVAVDITYDSTVAYCAKLGYVPITDTAPVAAGTVLFGGSKLNYTQVFYLDATAFDNNLECTEAMTNTTQFASTGYLNPCYYRYQHGFFDQYTFVTTVGNSLRGSAFYSGNFAEVKDYGTAANLFKTQYMSPYSLFYWNYDFLSYPVGQLYLVGMWSTDKSLNAVSRMDMPPTQDLTFSNRVGYRFTSTSANAAWFYNQLNVVCVAQSVQDTDSSKAPTQPIFVQGWKDLTWVQKHWYVPYVIIAAVILIVLLIILIVCCCKKNQEVENRIEGSMVVRERVGKAYAYENSDDEQEMNRSFHN